MFDAKFRLVRNAKSPRPRTPTTPPSARRQRSSIQLNIHKMLALALTAELNGVTDLRPNDTEDNPFHYTFKVQCTSCRETHPNPVTMTRFDVCEMSGSKGEANFVWKCKNCKVILALTCPQRISF